MRQKKKINGKRGMLIKEIEKNHTRYACNMADFSALLNTVPLWE